VCPHPDTNVIDLIIYSTLCLVEVRRTQAFGYQLFNLRVPSEAALHGLGHTRTVYVDLPRIAIKKHRFRYRLWCVYIKVTWDKGFVGL
jgi:hypothetical protein